MKSQRRHDLQENELAKAIKKAPNYWQQSGGKFLAALIAVLVIVILIRYRVSSSRQAQLQAIDALAQARGEISELQSSAAMSLLGPTQEMATQRRQLFNDATNAISQAMTLSDNHKLQAEALIARGDLNWTAGTLPELPGAATQPSLQLRDPKELLSAAAEAYQTVLTSYNDEIYAAIAAHFGLAAIDENHAQWDQAKAQYEAVKQISKDFPAYQQMAEQRLNNLPQLRNPVILAAAATEPAAPGAASTQPLPAGIAAPSALKPATTHAAAATTAPHAAAPGPATQK